MKSRNESNAKTKGHTRAETCVVVVLLLCCVLCVVCCVLCVGVEWLYYSKRIIIFRWADLSELFVVDFRL